MIGMDGATVRYDPKTGQFTHWTSGNNMFGLDPAGNVWHTDDGGPACKNRHQHRANQGVRDPDE